MNQVLDGPSHAPSSQGRQGLGLEFTNQRSVSSVLTGPSEHDLRPQEIADAGLKVGCCMFCLLSLHLCSISLCPVVANGILLVASSCNACLKAWSRALWRTVQLALGV